MEKYLGVKLIEAESFYSTDKEDEGYKVKYEDGYVSWSPKDVFEKAYRRIKAYKDIKSFVLENDKNFKDYQLRVCEEAFELDNKILQLENYLRIPELCANENEFSILKQQLMAMRYYLTMLVERIENFK